MHAPMSSQNQQAPLHGSMVRKRDALQMMTACRREALTASLMRLVTNAVKITQDRPPRMALWISSRDARHIWEYTVMNRIGAHRAMMGTLHDGTLSS